MAKWNHGQQGWDEQELGLTPLLDAVGSASTHNPMSSARDAHTGTIPIDLLQMVCCNSFELHNSCASPSPQKGLFPSSRVHLCTETLRRHP